MKTRRSRPPRRPDTGRGGGETLMLAADPGGALAFDQTELTAAAGEVTIELMNESGIPAQRRGGGERSRGGQRNDHRGLDVAHVDPGARRVRVLLRRARSPRRWHGGNAHRRVASLECSSSTSSTSAQACHRLVPPRGPRARAGGLRARELPGDAPRRAGGARARGRGPASSRPHASTSTMQGLRAASSGRTPASSCTSARSGAAPGRARAARAQRPPPIRRGLRPPLGPAPARPGRECEHRGRQGARLRGLSDAGARVAPRLVPRAGRLVPGRGRRGRADPALRQLARRLAAAGHRRRGLGDDAGRHRGAPAAGCSSRAGGPGPAPRRHARPPHLGRARAARGGVRRAAEADLLAEADPETAAVFQQAGRSGSPTRDSAATASEAKRRPHDRLRFGLMRRPAILGVVLPRSPPRSPSRASPRPCADTGRRRLRQHRRSRPRAAKTPRARSTSWSRRARSGSSTAARARSSSTSPT